MEIILNALLIVVGLAMLYFGAEWLVRGSVAISNKLNISQLVIGLTVVAFGTSSPELVVSLSAATKGMSDIALGNVVGSNIVNIGTILGISAMISPLAISKTTMRKEMPILIGVSLLLIAVVIDKKIDFYDGLILTGGIVSFTIFSYKSSKKENSLEIDESVILRIKLSKSILFLGSGLALLTAGAFLTVDHSIIIAKHVGISELVIGLTLVAIGTSLPELMTSIVAAKKGHAEIGVGNIIGSNIFNILAILGITSILAQITVADEILTDIGIMLVFTVALVPLMKTGFRITKREGLLLLSGYLAYTIWLFFKNFKII